MKCPFCNSEDTQVKDSRTTSNHTVVRRRRYCGSCHNKFSTVERIYFKELYVIKKSGIRKPFDRNKIRQSVQTATRKRNIPINELDKIINDTINQIESSKLKEISSRKIGEMLMQELLKLDLVSCVRFASVYKDFSTPEDFINFIKSIKN
ncbi:transcriptional regulator (repressor) NrdR [Candidatus Phycorickettsia trachydisci]|uniref:Transcriptional repressor NrdR n=1 Tax=Candidatus Phycorickettsia trachydisci TaxID=2115978 RepID=A0A2P1P8B9_9RICK|nr:transcriptional regulator NrdR [Candidatus Phycorickettsia trachydisci]AVP87504.1 transcriptional regulator (repressor) NrdR [Candidatus Phycorickettsia trachydisci]